MFQDSSSNVTNSDSEDAVALLFSNNDSSKKDYSRQPFLGMTNVVSLLSTFLLIMAKLKICYE